MSTHTPGSIRAAEIITGGTYGTDDRYPTQNGPKTVEGIADLIDYMTGAPDLLEACEEAQEVMDAAANQISEDRYIDADELKATANQLADYAMKLRDAILLADPPEFVEE